MLSYKQAIIILSIGLLISILCFAGIVNSMKSKENVEGQFEYIIKNQIKYKCNSTQFDYSIFLSAKPSMYTISYACTKPAKTGIIFVNFTAK